VSSPYFDEQRKRIIAFPNVAPGDKIRGRLIYKNKRPMLPGEFARDWYVAPSDPPEVMELTLDGPASKPLQIAARNVEHSEEQVGDRIVHHVRSITQRLSRDPAKSMALMARLASKPAPSRTMPRLPRCSTPETRRWRCQPPACENSPPRCRRCSYARCQSRTSPQLGR
jgi:Domain of Unknown Function with PDB structure (DUF3857)